MVASRLLKLRMISKKQKEKRKRGPGGTHRMLMKGFDWWQRKMEAPSKTELQVTESCRLRE